MLPGDRTRLAVAVRNLVDNAVKYGQEGDPPVEVTVESDVREVRVAVRDSGPGIATEEQTRVFEPFYRADPSRDRDTGGYGLGLYTCRRIVEAHGGHVSLDSKAQKGACFTIHLPLCDALASLSGQSTNRLIT